MTKPRFIVEDNTYPLDGFDVVDTVEGGAAYFVTREAAEGYVGFCEQYVEKWGCIDLDDPPYGLDDPPRGV